MEKKNPDPGSYFRDLRNNFYRLKILKYFDADPDPGSFRPWIRNKHPGSATLISPGLLLFCAQDQMLEPETFLPLDYIQAKPLKERLRNITSVRGVKLLYDVLNFNPPDIKRAVLFVTNNSLVCETPEDAMKVAYEMEDGQRFVLHRTIFSII
jgi:hypothetical protein